MSYIVVRILTTCVLLFQFRFPFGIQCQLCHMTFSDQSAINVHYDTAHAQISSRRQHVDAKHECGVCNRKFTMKGSLGRHLSTVHGIGDVKTFKCEICLKIFNRKHVLERHVATVHNLGAQHAMT